MLIGDDFFSSAKKLLKVQYDESMAPARVTMSDNKGIDSSHCSFNIFIANEKKISVIGICYLCFMHHLMEPVLWMKIPHKWQNFGYFLIVPTSSPLISTSHVVPRVIKVIIELYNTVK